MNFKGTVSVVTGAGGGIGRQLVIQLLERGARVAAIDINEQALDETRLEAGAKADKLTLHSADITCREVVDTLPAKIEEQHGVIDILINNAGVIQPFVPFADLEYEAIQRVININVYGPILVTRAFLPYLSKRPHAYIANVSSMGGFLPVPGQTLYGASKAAVKLLTEGLRTELARSNVGVSVIMPGGVNTNITKNSGVESGMEQHLDGGLARVLTSPQKAARIILDGIRRERPRILVGNDALLMDLMTRVAPVRASRLVSRLMAPLLDERFQHREPVQSHGGGNPAKR